MSNLLRLGSVAAMAFLLAGCGPTATESASDAPAGTATPAASSASAQPATSSPAKPTASSSTRPSQSTSLQPLRDQITKPQQAQSTHDDAGAVAFVQYYVAAQEWAQGTGEIDLLQATCLPENPQCARIVEGAQWLVDTGGVLYGGKNTLALGSELIVANPEPDRTIVQTRLMIAPTAVLDQSGDFTNQRPAFDETIAFHLQWQNDGWQVADAVKVVS